MGRNTTTEISWAQTRRDTSRQRRAPRSGSRVTLAFASGGAIPDVSLSAIVIQATDCAGEVAGWLDDGWWTDLFQRCAAKSLTIEIGPTRSSLTHPVVLHQLEMVRRIVANWRILGEGYADDYQSDDDIEQLATGPFHELRLREGGRSIARGTHPTESRFDVDELIGRIHSRAEQSPFASPVLIRIPQSRV